MISRLDYLIPPTSEVILKNISMVRVKSLSHDVSNGIFQGILLDSSYDH